jgi:hypothetical protein
LLLATGRRLGEILKTAVLGESKSGGPYWSRFSGQIKHGLSEAESYDIPLLAPYKIVATALAKVRQKYDCTKMNLAEINRNLEKQVGVYTHKLLGYNPHAMRAIYANMARILYGNSMTLPAFISTYLGHKSTSTAPFYMRYEVINFTSTQGYQPPLPVTETKEDKQEYKFTAYKGSADEKRRDAALQLIAASRKITANAIKTLIGGDMAVTKRWIEQNAATINEYNSS